MKTPKEVALELVEGKFFGTPMKVASKHQLRKLAKHTDHLIDNPEVDHYPTKKFHIKHLRATQDFIDHDTVKHKMGEKDDHHGVVYKFGGRHYVGDGHHKIVAAHRAGQTHVTMKYRDLDKDPVRTKPRKHWDYDDGVG